MDSAAILEILTGQDYITQEDAEAARAFEAAGSGTAVAYLLQNSIVSRSSLGLAIAEKYGTTYTDLDARAPSDTLISKLSEEVARTHRAIFVDDRNGEVRIATDAPDNTELIAALSRTFPKAKVRITYSFPEQIDALLKHYQKGLNTRFAEIVTLGRKVAPELFDEIIRDALTYRASDIHFEPGLEETRIRFRIDGMLRLAGTVSRAHYESVLNRMKILSNLRTDEHFMPQDGAIRFASGSTSVDLRLSIVPTLAGEKAVIRVLTEYVRGLSFDSLGFSPAQLELLTQASHKPFGMILTVGPTGSGKTTTLYALLRQLSTPDVNIMTIEDPVEYRMQGTNQIQVNAKTGLTFATGLRAVVRQDPNVILVGEIRDTETAETAVNAALTGHLLLSTFHANDAATAIPRLMDMDVEPYLLASTLELVIAQRLARRICEACRESYSLSAAEFAKTYPAAVTRFPKGPVTLYRGKGCASCNGTGYKGRVSIVELLPVGDSLRALIPLRPSAAAITELAAKEGIPTLFDDGIDKAGEGITTLDEVLRVAAPGTHA